MSLLPAFHHLRCRGILNGFVFFAAFLAGGDDAGSQVHEHDFADDDENSHPGDAGECPGSDVADAVEEGDTVAD